MSIAEVSPVRLSLKNELNKEKLKTWMFGTQNFYITYYKTTKFKKKVFVFIH